MSILQMGLSASAIILFAAILRKFALNRLPKRAFVALWLLAAARMLLPWKLPFRFSASALIHRTAEPAVRAIVPAVSVAAQRQFAPVAMAVATVQSARIPIWQIVWIVGMAACALALTLPHLRWRRVYARSLPVDDANIAGWLQSQRLLRHVRVRVSDEIPSPLTCGLLRPMILLPAGLNRSEGLEYVLEHELTHIRHLDALWKPVLAAALCAHWFNPLAWMMYLLANRDIELACDESVLRRLGAPARRDYARTLLDQAARQSGLPSPLFSGFSRQTIEERIKAIMKMKKSTKIAALAAALLIAFSAIAFATTGADTQTASDARSELEELIFDGYEDMSVRDYSAWLGELGVNYDTFAQDRSLWDEETYVDSKYYDFMHYVLEPLSDPDWEANGGWIRDAGFGEMNVDTGEQADANLRITCRILDEDRLSVSQLRDSLKAAYENMGDLNLLDMTQEQLEAHARALEEQCSDGSTIVFQIDVELVGEQSPYTDPDTEAQLQVYAELGLEYQFFLGELTMLYDSREVDGIWDPEAGSITANSTGPNGLRGGNILEVIYEDGKPTALRFIEK